MVNLSSTGISVPSATETQIPPLDNGDCLTRHEFHRRYAAATHIKKAELIEGIVYVASPLRFERHANPHGRLITWLGVYEAATPGVKSGIEPTVQLDEDNEFQPDAVLLRAENLGGQSRLTEEDYIQGAPELVAEVAASSVAIDLHAKKTAYRRNGVREYLVWQVFENKLDWFSLEAGAYLLLSPDAEGMLKSRIFPGLWLDATALLQGDMQRVLAGLQLGLNSVEHQAFGQQLGG